ncbi:Fc.00g051430.m01.CDS01 [Cosmosporella sp. VM-42]
MCSRTENDSLDHILTSESAFGPSGNHLRRGFGDISSEIQHHLDVLQKAASAVTLSAVVNVDKRVEEGLADARQRSLDEERKAVLQWLSPTDFDSIQAEMLRKRWPNTGRWLLGHEHFKSWLSGRGRFPLLWCTGPPGTGKSVLAGIIIDYIGNRCTNKPQVSHLAYAYFTYRELEKNQAKAIVACLTKQLIRSHKAIPDGILRTFQDHNGQDRRPTLETSTKSEITVVIDALDECRDEDRELFMDRFVYELLQNVPSARVLITSRPEPSVSHYIHQPLAREIKITTPEAKQDIGRYIQGRVDLLTQHTTGLDGRPRMALRVEDPLLRDQIVKHLEDQSAGMFLWVDLQLNQISRQKNDHDVREVLKTLPRGLNETYLRILKQIEQESKPLMTLVVKFLMWMTHSRTRWRRIDLQDAVAIDDTTIDIAKLHYSRMKYTMDDIIDICRGLLVTRDVKCTPLQASMLDVRLVHFSLVEFLMTDLSISRSSFSILQDPGAIECELAKVCVSHLTQVVLTVGQATNFSNLQLRLLYDTPFAWYCAQFFDEHAVKATMTPSLKKLIENLLATDSSWLATLAQLRHLRSPVQLNDFLFFHWDVKSRAIIETSRLAELPFIREDSQWESTRLYPNSLHLACANGNLDQVKRLLDYGLVPEATDGSGQSSFIIAIFRQHLKVAEFLLGAESDINQKYWHETLSRNASYETALEIVSRFGNVALVTMLLKNGAKGIEEDSTFRSALLIAVEAIRREVAVLLLSYGAEPTGRVLLSAAENGMTEIVEACLRSGIDPNGEQGSTPLYGASKWGWIEVISILLEYQADVNLVGGSLGTPLQAAALGGRLDVIQLLLSHGAGTTINCANGDYGTALSAAAYGGHDTVIPTLLNAGAGVNVLGGILGSALAASVESRKCSSSNKAADQVIKCKINPVHLSESSKMTIKASGRNVTKNIIEAGADLANQGTAALTGAVKKGRTDLVRLLLSHGALFDPRILIDAVRSRQSELVKIMLQHGMDPNGLNSEGHSPLIEAVQSKNPDIVRMLAEAGADTNLPAKNSLSDATGHTRALHQACSRGHLAIAKILLENHADPNLLGIVNAMLEGPDGSTSRNVQVPALHAACGHTYNTNRSRSQLVTYRDLDEVKAQQLNKVDIVALLIENGARIDQLSGDGWTALEFACSRHGEDPGTRGAYEIVSMLIDAGANIVAPGCDYSGPLETADQHGLGDIVDLFLSKGNNDEIQKQNALQVAAGEGYATIVSRLIKDGVDVRVPKGSSKFVREKDRPIHSAALLGHDSIVEELIDAGAQIHEEGYYGTVHETALVGYALNHFWNKGGGWGKIIKRLRQQGAAEPPASCHYGVLCSGPICAGTGGNDVVREEA